MTRLSNWRDCHQLCADMLMAFFGAGCTIALAVWLLTSHEIEQLLRGSRSPMYTTIASITGSLLGFILTAVSIIAVFLQTPRFVKLHKTDTIKDVFAIYTSATRWLAFATVWIIIAIIVDTDDHPQLIATAVTLGVVSVASMRVFRCVWALEKIINIASKPLRDVQDGPSASQ